MCENILPLMVAKRNNQRYIKIFIFKDVFAALLIRAASLKLKTILIPKNRVIVK